MNVSRFVVISALCVMLLACSERMRPQAVTSIPPSQVHPVFVPVAADIAAQRLGDGLMKCDGVTMLPTVRTGNSVHLMGSGTIMSVPFSSLDIDDVPNGALIKVPLGISSQPIMERFGKWALNGPAC